MRVLLVGGNSSLAQCLRPMLADCADVVTAGRNGCDLALDLASAVNIPLGFDSVVNTAAHLGGPTPAALASAEATNVLGLLALGHACAEAGVRHFVQVSSIFATLTASSPFHNAYALSKRHGDEALQLQARMHDMPLTILRPSQLYGLGESYRRNQPFLFTLMDKAQAGQDIELWGRRDALRNFIHAQDVANTIARVVFSRTLGVYTCSHPQNLSFSQIAHAAVDAFGTSSAIRFLPEKPDTADNIFPFDDALYRTLGHGPQITLAQGMQMEAAHRRSST
jgi:nucleoside-diphosphate-sugar epimerase